jgi:hypothetical protein
MFRASSVHLQEALHSSFLCELRAVVAVGWLQVVDRLKSAHNLQPENLLPVPGFELQAIQYVAKSLHLLSYPSFRVTLNNNNEPSYLLTGECGDSALSAVHQCTNMCQLVQSLHTLCSTAPCPSAHLPTMHFPLHLNVPALTSPH